MLARPISENLLGPMEGSFGWGRSSNSPVYWRHRVCFSCVLVEDNKRLVLQISLRGMLYRTTCQDVLGLILT
ncbi:hypothetical protein AVEN_158478-1 [Araneus ventricosus]|uniref:Uncharacterized protein n=1 Tax=Araneus ventricosus TaxID=182803 RepID=A0A4Y2WNP8_ARAVE|nr:hypothetical protein AVEN_158478-1 [Araneus ventricosus]